MIRELPATEYWKVFNNYTWTDYDRSLNPRAFWVYPNDIYINSNAFYFSPEDKRLLIAHEVGHAQGLEHSLTGVMSPFSVVRYITSSYEGAIIFILFIFFVIFIIYKLRK